MVKKLVERGLIFFGSVNVDENRSASRKLANSAKLISRVETRE